MPGPFQKVSPHVRSNTTNGLSWVQNTNSVKALVSTGGQSLLGDSFGLKVIRYVFPSQSVTADQNAGKAAADTVMNNAGSSPYDVVEGYNEICGNSSDCLAAYLVWTQGFVNEVHARGKKAACFSFGVGTPTNLFNLSGQIQSPNDWDQIAASGLLNPGQCDYIALHQYWDAISGPADRYTALRHRDVHNYLVGIGHANHPPFLLTEIGYDCIYGRTWPDKGCGTSHCGWISQGLTAQQAADGFITFDGEISADSYVAYGYAFTNGGGSDFGCFEIDLLAPYLFTGGTLCGAQGQPCCTSGAPCNSGLTCLGGTCQPIVFDPCAQINCFPGYHCDQGYCICSSDTECISGLGSGFRCVSGSCVQTPPTGCLSDQDCTQYGAGFVCDEVTGLCIAPNLQPPGLSTAMVVGAVVLTSALFTAIVIANRRHHVAPHVAPVAAA